MRCNLRVHTHCLVVSAASYTVQYELVYSMLFACGHIVPKGLGSRKIIMSVSHSTQRATCFLSRHKSGQQVTRRFLTNTCNTKLAEPGSRSSPFHLYTTAFQFSPVPPSPRRGLISTVLNKLWALQSYATRKTQENPHLRQAASSTCLATEA